MDDRGRVAADDLGIDGPERRLQLLPMLALEIFGGADDEADHDARGEHEPRPRAGNGAPATARAARAARGRSTKARFSLRTKTTELRSGRGPRANGLWSRYPGSAIPGGPPHPAGEHDAAEPTTTLAEMTAEGRARQPGRFSLSTDLLRCNVHVSSRFTTASAATPPLCAPRPWVPVMLVLALDGLEHRREGRPLDVAAGAALGVELAVGPDHACPG